MNSRNPVVRPRGPRYQPRPAAGINSGGKRAPADFDLGLKSLAGGEFWMGEDRPNVARPEDAEGPVRRAFVEQFAIGIAPIKIAQWARFVAATGYISEAENFG